MILVIQLLISVMQLLMIVNQFLCFVIQSHIQQIRTSSSRSSRSRSRDNFRCSIPNQLSFSSFCLFCSIYSSSTSSSPWPSSVGIGSGNRSIIASSISRARSSSVSSNRGSKGSNSWLSYAVYYSLFFTKCWGPPTQPSSLERNIEIKTQLSNNSDSADKCRATNPLCPKRLKWVKVKCERGVGFMECGVRG